MLRKRICRIGSEIMTAATAIGLTLLLAGCGDPPSQAALCRQLPDAHEADIWSCVIMSQERDALKTPPHAMPRLPSPAAAESEPSL